MQTFNPESAGSGVKQSRQLWHMQGLGMYWFFPIEAVRLKTPEC